MKMIIGYLTFHFQYDLNNEPLLLKRKLIGCTAFSFEFCPSCGVFKGFCSFETSLPSVFFFQLRWQKDISTLKMEKHIFKQSFFTSK